jgi:plasmid stabilization system protein ParE
MSDEYEGDDILDSDESNEEEHQQVDLLETPIEGNLEAEALRKQLLADYTRKTQRVAAADKQLAELRRQLEGSVATNDSLGEMDESLYPVALEARQANQSAADLRREVLAMRIESALVKSGLDGFDVADVALLMSNTGIADPRDAVEFLAFKSGASAKQQEKKITTTAKRELQAVTSGGSRTAPPADLSGIDSLEAAAAAVTAGFRAPK